MWSLPHQHPAPLPPSPAFCSYWQCSCYQGDIFLWHMDLWSYAGNAAHPPPHVSARWTKVQCLGTFGTLSLKCLIWTITLMQTHHLLSLFCTRQIYWIQHHSGTTGDWVSLPDDEIPENKKFETKSGNRNDMWCGHPAGQEQGLAIVSVWKWNLFQLWSW